MSVTITRNIFIDIPDSFGKTIAKALCLSEDPWDYYQNELIIKNIYYTITKHMEEKSIEMLTLKGFIIDESLLNFTFDVEKIDSFKPWDSLVVDFRDNGYKYAFCRFSLNVTISSYNHKIPQD